jgi:hypothetical protein
MRFGVISHCDSAIGKTKIAIACCFFTVLSLFYISVIESAELDTVFAIAAIALTIDMAWLNKALNHFLCNRRHFFSIHSALENALNETLKSRYLYRPVKNELFVVFYAFFAKHFPEEYSDNLNSFSYTKSSNAKDIFWVVAIAQIPTLPFIHFIIEKEANPIAAWIVTALTMWSVIYYLAQAHAVRFNPVQLTKANLNYRYGIAWAADIPLVDINVARKLTYTDKPNPFDFFISPIGSSKNIVLEFNTPIKFKGRNFLDKNKSKAVLSVDNPDALLTQLAKRGVSIT